MIKVTLEWYEYLFAEFVGKTRNQEALKMGKKDAHGYDGSDGLAIHIQGAVGEFVVAKALNIHWPASINTFKMGGDVGPIQVRTAKEHNHRLIVRSADSDGDNFVFVTGKELNYIVQGWIKGKDAKSRKWLDNPAGREAAYFVPVSALNRMPPTNPFPPFL